MSWFRHKPRIKDPGKMRPQKSSPLSDKLFETLKEEVKKPSQKFPDNKPTKE